MSNSLEAEFGVVRSFFWPIRRYEVKKILPMFFMTFLICFTYSIIRNMKDSVIISAAGATVIPFVKVWAMLPMAVLLTYTFAKLSNRFSQERVFYIMVTGFVLFFALFGYIVFPMREQLHMDRLANFMDSVLPESFAGFTALFRYWSFTLFYAMAEMWSSIVLTVLFMGFANEVTTVKESRRFYCVMSIGSNIAAIFAGQVANFFSQSSEIFGEGAWQQTVTTLCTVMTVAGVLTMAIFYWMNRKVLDRPEFEELHHAIGEPKVLTHKKKKKLSMRESFSHLSNSKYLLCIAVLVFSYNLVINLVEVVWKGQLHALYPNPNDLNAYLNNLTSSVGIVSTITAFFMARLITRFGWTFLAIATPMIMLVTSLGFFSFFFFQDTLAPIAMMLGGATPLTMVVFFGAAQNCLSKAAKYSVFDASKEMAYIPLPHEVKLKGKAAIDGVGSRLGKSGGSLIQMGLLVMMDYSLIAIAPYVAGILVFVIGGWIAAVKVLGVEYESITAEADAKDKAEERERELRPAVAKSAPSAPPTTAPAIA